MARTMPQSHFGVRGTLAWECFLQPLLILLQWCSLGLSGEMVVCVRGSDCKPQWLQTPDYRPKLPQFTH
jgi:hypothetical protein